MEMQFVYLWLNMALLQATFASEVPMCVPSQDVIKLRHTISHLPQDTFLNCTNIDVRHQ